MGWIENSKKADVKTVNVNTKRDAFRKLLLVFGVANAVSMVDCMVYLEIGWFIFAAGALKRP